MSPSVSDRCERRSATRCRRLRENDAMNYDARTTTRLGLFVLLLVLAVTQPGVRTFAQTPPAAQGNPPGAFTDPDRRAKLARRFRRSIGCSKFVSGRTCPARPGASSSTASSRTSGVDRLSRRRRQGAGGRRHRVPHRVDDEELHRDGDSQAARRGQAVARRSRRALRAGVGGAPYPTTRLAAHHDPPPAVARGRLSRGQPVGRPAARRHRRARCRRCCDGGIPFSNAPGVAYEYSNYGFAILGRIVVARVADVPYRDYIAAEHSAAARHDVDDARARGGAGGPPRARLSLGRRTVEARAAAARRRVRRDGWHADVGQRPRPLRRRASSRRGRRATARRPAPVRRASLREMQQISRPRPPSVARDARSGVDAAQCRRLRLRARHLRRPATSATSSRTAAGCPGSAR